MGDTVVGETKKFVMRPPQVVKVGAKKTAFVNFAEIAKMLHRQPKHLLAFLFAELGTTGACDGNNQLVMKGKFQQKHIENVLRRYIKEYVTCHTCRSPDTILNKETRLFFLQCMTCHSRCSVLTIKTGFRPSLARDLPSGLNSNFKCIFFVFLGIKCPKFPFAILIVRLFLLFSAKPQNPFEQGNPSFFPPMY